MSTDQQRTEDPTQRRLEKSRNEGQVAFSADLVSGALLMIGSLFFIFFGPWFGRKLTNLIRLNLSNMDSREMTAVDAQQLGVGSLVELGNLIAPLALTVVAIVGLVGTLVTGFRITFKPLETKLDKLDPRKGFKRIFSSRSLVRGVNAVFKVTLMTVIAIWLIRLELPAIGASTGKGVGEAISIGWSIALRISLAISAAMLLLGTADLVFQKWKHFQDMKMSKQEVRDEHKDDEGDPMIRARLKKLQRERTKQQMLRDVPDATVVITNPTHLAIALKYDRDTLEAPRVVAKGADHLAETIKRIARDNGVPVLERKPLARALYKSVEIGDEIPTELFQAVAEILAYIYRQQGMVA